MEIKIDIKQSSGELKSMAAQLIEEATKRTFESRESAPLYKTLCEASKILYFAGKQVEAGEKAKTRCRDCQQDKDLCCDCVQGSHYRSPQDEEESLDKTSGV